MEFKREKESYFLDSLYKGTAEQASPYIILLANGCKYVVAKIYARIGTGFLEQPFTITGLFLYAE